MFILFDHSLGKFGGEKKIEQEKSAAHLGLNKEQAQMLIDNPQMLNDYMNNLKANLVNNREAYVEAYVNGMHDIVVHSKNVMSDGKDIFCGMNFELDVQDTALSERVFGYFSNNNEAFIQSMHNKLDAAVIDMQAQGLVTIIEDEF